MRSIWRSDLSSFITPEAVRACLDGERERGVDYRNCDFRRVHCCGYAALLQDRSLAEVRNT